jgi:hypothetical protein
MLGILDISEPTEPKKVAEISMPGTLGMAYLAGIANPGIYVTGKYAYIASRGSGLHVIDIENPQSPSIIGYIESPMQTGGIYVMGGYAYVAAQEALQIIDIGEPSQPRVVGSILPDAKGVHVMGNHAYVVSLKELHVIDVREPSQPKITGSINLPLEHHDARSVYVTDNYAYVAGRKSGTTSMPDGTVVQPSGSLQIIDVSEPQALKIVGSIEIPRTKYGDIHPGGWDVYVVDDYAYVTAEHDGLQVIDVSDPQNPGIMTSMDIHEAKRIHVDGDLAYVGGEADVVAIDISNPEAPRILGRTWVSGYMDDIYAADGYVYVAAQLSLEILQIEGRLEEVDVEPKKNDNDLGSC